MEYNKLIFVAQTGTCREAMAAGIMGDFTLRHPLEILSRGLVVQFQEPMNQKAEAVLISNGINMENYVSQQLTEEDLTEDALSSPWKKFTGNAFWSSLKMRFRKIYRFLPNMSGTNWKY